MTLFLSYSITFGGLDLLDYGIPLQFGPTMGDFKLDLSLGTVRFMIHGDELGSFLLGRGIRPHFSPSVPYFELDLRRGDFQYLIHGDELVINLQEFGIVLRFCPAAGNISLDLNHGSVRIWVQGFLSVLPLLNGNNTGPHWTFSLQNN